MKSWPFPSLLDLYLLKEPQKLRLDLSAVSYAASMTACERVSYWEQVGHRETPGCKAEKLPIWEYGKDGTWLKCQKYWIAPDAKLEIWWRLIYIERLHHKIIELGYFSSFCLGLLLEILQHAIFYMYLFFLFLDHSPNIRNIYIYIYRERERERERNLAGPKAGNSGFWVEPVWLLSPGSHGSRPLKRIVPLKFWELVNPLFEIIIFSEKIMIFP